MTATPTPDAPLSPHWAFVVQLREGTALTPEGLHGRVEYIVSGQVALFISLEALGAFMAQVLAAPGGDAFPRPAPAPEQGGQQ
jgi:hypothetical protein